jgi:beta-N-acetylhexosaminidase
MKQKVFIFIFFILTPLSLRSQTNLAQQAWVDSVFYEMSLDEKIGQLFMVRAFSKSDPIETGKILSYIDSLHIGGLCFFQGSPVKQAELTNLYQSNAKVPLFIGIDGEWGLGMRFPESVMKFPKQLTLGAMAEEDLVYKMGEQIANQCNRMGIHFNFAPVVDVNNNAANPVINERAFGEDKFYVTTKAIAYMKGLQDHNVLATAKHFPGHGDTDIDSHLELPILNHTLKRLYDVELFPFKALINEGVASIMIGHLQIPQLDDRPKRSASLSYRIVTELLKEELGYNGLIITDAMEMKGVAKHFPNGVAEAEAFLAGCDLILMPEDLPTAIAVFKSYVNSGKIYPSRIDESVKKILSAKYKANAFNRKKINTIDLISYLNNNESVGLKTTLIESAITLVVDNNNALPFENYRSKKIMTVGIGVNTINTFHKRLDDYHTFNHNVIKKEIPFTEKNKLLDKASNFDYTIVSIHDMSRSPDKGYGITKSSIDFVAELARKTKVVLVIFGSAYSLKYFEGLPTIVMAYEDDDLFQDITAQTMFGVNAFNGRLPVSASNNFGIGTGLSKNKLSTLGYVVPERVGLSSKKLDDIDDLVKELIAKKAAPGCAIIVAKDNKIVYQKSFGKHTYAANARPVQNTDVYDVASLTKILSGTLGMMKLYDENKIDIQDPLQKYIPEISNSDKGQILISDVMAHQGRLVPFIPFYEETIVKQKKKNSLMPKYYKTISGNDYNIPVMPNMYLKKSYVDTIWKKIYESPLRANEGYKYSDLGFYFVKKIVENVSTKKIDKYVDEQFYTPLGLQSTMYNPLDKIPVTRIPPTENDNYWRNNTVQGTVHDMGAAMLGGIGGHAGLFSNTKEIAVIMQMLLNQGSYAGKKYLSESTVDLFTTRHYKSSRRGLGFDLKETDGQSTMNMASLAPNSTYGHTGFTGTCVYGDPENKIIFVFLSNRTYPDMDNNLLNKNDYRIKIQDCIYKALLK